MSEAVHVAAANQEVRLGKLEVKHDDRNLQLARYLAPSLTPPPAQVSRISKVESVIGGADWGMMGNDRLGDCTAAALGHAEQVWVAYTKSKARRPTDRAIENLYWDTGNGTRQDDTGRVELDVLNYVSNHGVYSHKLYAFAQVGLTNADLVKQAIYLFGVAYIGLAMPKSAQHQLVWDVATSDSEPGSWGGHAVIIVDYDTFGPTCITWGKAVKMSWAFFWKYTDEAYALLESEWFSKGKTIDGFDKKALMADLEAIK